MALIAHRGDPMRTPENTLASFQSALHHGAQALEADLRRTSDGEWVIFHDPSLKRTTGQEALLASTPWEKVRHLDAGGWFSSRFKGEPIPALSDLLKLCQAHQADLFLDLKVSGEEEGLARLLAASGWLARIKLGVSELSVFGRWRRFLKEVPLFWVTGYRDSITSEKISIARRWRLAGFVAYRRWVTAQVVRRVHEKDLKLYVWTVRNKSQLSHFVRMRVDGLMSELWPPPEKIS